MLGCQVHHTPPTIIIDIIMSVKIALAQVEIAFGDPEINFVTGLIAIDQAVAEGCQHVQLPELWISGYDLPNREKYSQLSLGWGIRLQALANSRQISIGGSTITCQDDHFYNTFQLFLPGQPGPAQYHKTHLFRLLDEQEYLTPGDELTVVDLGWGKVGLALCYDLRFPELIRAYTERGIDCLLVAAQWGQKRSEHWRTLLKARAIENQIFVAAANAVGPLLENKLAGYSAVIDPWGNVLTEAGSDAPALLIAEIDLTEINRVREVVPSTYDRRKDLYRRWAEEFVSEPD